MVKNIGPLERKILEILWEKKQATAREISNSLEKSGNRKAYSTIRTIINRLVKKELLRQSTILTREHLYILLSLLKMNWEKKL